MSASRDQSQKIAFVYSNLYSLYQKGKAAAQDAVLPSEQPKVEAKAETKIDPSVSSEAIVAFAKAQPMSKSSHVIKTGDLNKPEKSSTQVSSFAPTEFIGKRVARPASLPPKAATPAAPKEAISSLKDNLKALNDLHARLRFMLQELEDLVKN